MATKVNKKTTTRVLAKLRKGLSLREIAAQVGISNQLVWRIGAANGVYSSRSARENTYV